jgi:hypothetical protein
MQTGPLGFQVTTAAGLPDGAICAVADFGSRAEAEAFVASMRTIDAGRTTIVAAEKPC